MAVDGLDLEVRRGECFGMLGPNGAGKTTTVEILEGLNDADAGEVEVLGERWVGDGRALRARIGVHLQETKYPEKARVREVLTLFRSFYPGGFGVAETLAMVELQEKAEAFVRTLSGYEGGFKTTLDYVTGRYRSIDAVAAKVAEDLRAIGIEVELRAHDLAAFRKHVSTERDTALFLMSWLSATGDAGTTFSVAVHTPDTEGHGIYSTYSSPEVDQLITDSYGPVSLSRRRQLLGAVAERVHADMAVVPLYRQWDLYAFASNLDFQPRLDRRIRGFDMKWRDAAR